MQGHDFLHELNVLRQADQIIRERLNGRNCSYSARVQCGWVHVPPLHQAEHLAGQSAHDKAFAVKLAFERIQRVHDLTNGLVSVILRVRSLCLLRLFPNARVGFLHHLFTEIDADQVVLENAMIEHVFRRFAQIHDPLTQRGRFNAIRHVLCVNGAGRVIVAANPANAAGDEMGIPRILVLHEDAIAAKDGRGAVAFGNLLLGEIDLRINAEASHNTGDWVPGHFDQVSSLLGSALLVFQFVL